MLGPCDGPPPAEFVTPLGDSLPTAANGSIAPLAPDLSAALRTIRALRDEQFDVLARARAAGARAVAHRPHVPPRPDRRHVPRGRPIVELPDLPAGPRRLARPHRSARRGVEGRPRAGAGPPRRRVPGAVQRRRDRRHPCRRAVPAHPSGDLLPRPSRGAQGTRGAVAALQLLGPDVSCWIAGDGPDYGHVAQRVRPRPPRSSGSAGSPTTTSSRGSAVRRCSARRRCTASRSASC